MPDHKTIVIGSPSRPFLASMAETLKDAPDVLLAGGTEEGDQLMRLIPAANPDAVILDPALNGLCGEELLNRILDSGLTAPVLVPDIPRDGAIRAFLASHPERFRLCPAEPQAILAEIRALPGSTDREAEPPDEQEIRIGGILQEFNILPSGKEYTFFLEIIRLFLSQGESECPVLRRQLQELSERYPISENGIYGLLKRKLNSVSPDWPATLVRKYFGPSFASGGTAPSVGQFVGVLAGRVREEELREALGPGISAALQDIGLSEEQAAFRCLREAILLYCGGAAVEESGLPQVYETIAQRRKTDAETVHRALLEAVDAVAGTCGEEAAVRWFGHRFSDLFPDPDPERSLWPFLVTLGVRIPPGSGAPEEGQSRKEEEQALPAKRIVLGDPSGPFRAAFAKELRREAPRMRLVGMTDNGNHLLVLVRTVSPDAVALNPALRGPDGQELLTRIEALDRKAPVLLFAAPSQDSAREASSSQGNVFLSGSAKPKVIARELKALLSGKGDGTGTPKKPIAPEPESSVEKALLELRINPSTKGYRYLVKLIDICLRQDPREEFVQQKLADLAAGELSVDSITLRTTSRAVLVSAFPKWSDRIRTKYFGSCYAARKEIPTTSRLIGTIAERIRMQSSPEEMETRAWRSLLELGFDPTLKGYRHLKEALVLCLRSEGDGTGSRQSLFAATAERHSVSVDTVCGVIQLAIDRTSALWSDQVVASYFGPAFGSLKKTPSAAQLIKVVIRKIRGEIDLEERVSAALQDLGLSAEQSSRRYLLEAVLLYLRGEAVEESELYQAIADRLAVSAETASGGLREALESVAAHRDREMADRDFEPGSVNLSRSENGELAVAPFLAGIADRIRESPSFPSADLPLRKETNVRQPAEAIADRAPSGQPDGGSGEEGRSAPAEEAENGDQLLKLIDILKPEAVMLRTARTDADKEELQNRIRAQAHKPLLLFSTAQSSRIEAILLELNVSKERKAFSCLRDGVQLVLEHPEEYRSASRLYRKIAERNGTKDFSVQSVLLAQVHNSLANTSAQVLEKYFGTALAGLRRTSGFEFIVLIAGWIRLEQTAGHPDGRNTGPDGEARGLDRTRQKDSPVCLPACRKVMIAVPSEQIRARYADLLESEPEFVLCDGTGDGEQLLERIRHTNPDAVFLDPALNGLSGQALVDRIAALERSPVVLFSACTAEMRIEAIFTELEFPRRKKVFAYLCDTILLVYRDKGREMNFEQALTRTAQANGISVSAIVHQASAPISAVWKGASLRIREKYFGSTFARQETVSGSTFVFLLAAWMRLEDSPEARESVVERVLLDLGFDPSLRAQYDYLRDTILFCLEQDADSRLALTPVYSRTAEKHSVTAFTVGNAIRRAIRNARCMWTDSVAEKYFGSAFGATGDEPANGVFLAWITDWIRRNTSLQAEDPSSGEGNPGQTTGPS